MKWFSNIKMSDDPIEQAERSIEYLKKAGEKPEKWKVYRDLRVSIKRGLLPEEILTKIVDLRWRQLYTPIAAMASSNLIDEIMKTQIKDQSLFAVLIYNKNLSMKHAQSILEMCDDSERGIANARAIERKFGLTKQDRN